MSRTCGTARTCAGAGALGALKGLGSRNLHCLPVILLLALCWLALAHKVPITAHACSLPHTDSHSSCPPLPPRRLALAHKVPIITTIAGAKATSQALRGLKSGVLEQVPLQDYFN